MQRDIINLTRSRHRAGYSVSQGLASVRKAARKDKKVRFIALLHHLTVNLLRESFYALKRKAAPGVDGVTWQEYEADLPYPDFVSAVNDSLGLER